MSFLDVILPLYNAERAVGLLPLARVTTKRHHVLMFSQSWPLVLHSLSVYGMCMYFAVVCVMKRILYLMHSRKPFQKNIDSYLLLVNMFTILVVPFTNWMSARQNQTYVDMWIDFENIYQKVTLRENVLNLRRRVVGVVVCLVLYVAVLGTVAVVLSMLDPEQPSAVGYLPALCWMLAINYLTVSGMLTSQQVLLRTADNFRKVLVAEVSTRTQEELATVAFHLRVDQFSTLWLLLSRLGQHTGAIFSSRLLQFYLNRCVQLTILTYGLVTTPEPRLGWLYFSLLGEMLLVTNAGHQITYHVSNRIHNQINVLQSHVKDVECRRKFYIFLDVIRSNEASVNLSGFFTVNRALLTTVSLTLSTYLIVLVQFQFGATTED